MSFAPNLNLSTISGTVSAIHERLTPTPYLDPDKAKEKQSKQPKAPKERAYSEPKVKRQKPVQGTTPSFSDVSEPVKSPRPTGRPPMPSFSGSGEGNPLLPGPMSEESKRLDAFLTRPLDGRTETRVSRPASPVDFSHPEEAPVSPSAAPGSASPVFSNPAPAPAPSWTPTARVVPSEGSSSVTGVPANAPSFGGRPTVPSPYRAQAGNVGAQFSSLEPAGGETPSPTGPSHAVFSHVKPVAKEAARILPLFME